MSYSNVHGVTGALIALGGYQAGGDPGLLAGLAAAFLSHDLLDRIGEKSYGDMRASFVWEFVPLMVFLAVVSVHPLGWVLGAGWIAGNMMDLIDKRLYLSVFGLVEPGEFFPCHRRSPTVPLTQRQTKALTIIATIGLLVISSTVM